MATDIIINGALGRMGMEIANIILSDESTSLAGCIEYPEHQLIGKDYGTCIGKGTIGVKVSDSLSETVKGVIIDFSSPKSTRQILEKASKLNMPVVVGTTGLTENDYNFARDSSRHIPVIVSPNMSLGVNLLFSLTKMVSDKLKDSFDIEIIEAHHRFKKDAPSGTAKKLGEIVAESLGESYNSAVRNGRQGISDEIRTPKEIGMHAVRGGDIVGDHTVLFAGIGERIELRHMAHSRATFARGAVHVAKWLAQQNPGYYSMNDVLGL